ncbi:MAG: nucleotidyltransferase family protein [Acidiferrobacter sp.]
MITGLLLAAGRSQRFGSDKLLQRLDGGPPLALRCAQGLQPAVDRLVVIVHPEATAVSASLRAAGITVVCCPHAENGLGASLAFGIRVTGGAHGWLVALADMPYIAPATAVAVATRLRAGAIIVAPFFRGQRGHPVGFGRALGPELGALSGDIGATAVIRRHRHLLTPVPTDDAGIIIDIDTPDDLHRADLEATGSPGMATRDGSGLTKPLAKNLTTRNTHDADKTESL